MYLIIGANGYMGSYIIKNILEKTNDNITATARDIDSCRKQERVNWISCEVGKDEDIAYLRKISEENSGLKVVYLAAYHKPDLVQENPELAWSINVIALAKILNELKNIDCLFYASTDSVYGNSIDSYHFREDDQLNPENIYGRQKKTAEALVTGYDYNVVRYPFLIGPSLLEKKKHFYDTIAETLISGKEFEMFTDSYRSSLDFNQAAGLLVDIMQKYSKDIPKILNICGDEDLSKYDIGLMIADRTGSSRNLVKGISVKDADNIFKAPRAQSTLMDNSRLKKVLGLKEVKICI